MSLIIDGIHLPASNLKVLPYLGRDGYVRFVPTGTTPKEVGERVINPFSISATCHSLAPSGIVTLCKTYEVQPKDKEFLIDLFYSLEQRAIREGRHPT